MARLFDDASSQFLEVDATPVTAIPFTIAGWFRSDSATAGQVMMWIGDKDVADHYWLLRAAGNIAGDPVRIQRAAGGTNANTDTTTGYTAGTWHHAAAVFTTAIDVSVYIDGGSEGNGIASREPLNADRVSIGRAGDSTPDSYFSGDLMEWAIWNVALSDAEVLSLVTAAYPGMVQPSALVRYWPILGQFDPEVDMIAASNLTVTGATRSEHRHSNRRWGALAGVGI